MRSAKRSVLAAAGLLFLATATAQESRHDWSINLELDAFSSRASTKLSAESDSAFARIALLYSRQLGSTVSFETVIDAVNGGTSGIDVTEAFVNWQPVPRSPFRHKLRAGIFYPPLSLENNGPGWASPYTTSFSAINTWVGEELRTIGTEWSVERSIGPRARKRHGRFIAAVYYANDPAGAILSWRGWAIHSRQSRLGDAIELPTLPQVQPDGMFHAQALATEAFVETDHAPGYYYGAEWQQGERFLLTAMHYDNHADPNSLKDGHYGWTTRFDHLGIKAELPAALGLIVQWMDGTTVMGPFLGGARVVDNAFESWFALLTRTHGQHRWSVRYDDFAVSDLDIVPLDDNNETGDAWTVAYRYQPEPSWSVGFEWQALNAFRPALAYAGQPVQVGENLARVSLRYQLGSSPGGR